MRFGRYLLIAILMLGSARLTQAALLLQYNMGQAGPQVQNQVLGSNLTNGGSLTGFITNATLTPVYASAPVLQVNPSITATTAAAAYTANDYFFFTLTVGANILDLDLTSIDFQSARGGPSTPRGFGIRVDTPTTTDLLVRNSTDVGTARATFTDFTTDLSSITSLQNLTAGQVVRFEVAVYTPGTGSSLEFDNIVVNGNFTAVPEPGSVALAGCGLALAFCAWRKRQ